jgi:N-acetylneuraminic acid mutarotase
MPAPRSGYALAVLEGKLYLFGGWDGQRYRSEVWQYDPGANSWTPRKPMPTARAFAAAAVVENAVYVVGGANEQGGLATNERYIPAEDNDTGSPWAVKAKLPNAADHIAAASIGDQIFLLGGAQDVNQLLIYTADNDSWRADKFPLAATSDLRTQAIGNKLYILGGRGAGTANPQVYEYQAIYSVLLPAISN